jgi:hypothetical protein
MVASHRSVQVVEITSPVMRVAVSQHCSPKGKFVGGNRSMSATGEVDGGGAAALIRLPELSADDLGQEKGRL